MVHMPHAHSPLSSAYSKSTNSHQRRALAKREARLTTTTHSPNNIASSSVRIIIADDHELVREVTRSILNSEPDLRIIDEAKDGQETIDLCRLQCPEVVLMDVRMPKMNGLEATQTIKEELPT